MTAKKSSKRGTRAQKVKEPDVQKERGSIPPRWVVHAERQRTLLRLDKSEVAERAGLRPNTYSAFISGKAWPALETFEKLAPVLGFADVSEFFRPLEEEAVKLPGAAGDLVRLPPPAVPQSPHERLVMACTELFFFLGEYLERVAPDVTRKARDSGGEATKVATDRGAVG